MESEGVKLVDVEVKFAYVAVKADRQHVNLDGLSVFVAHDVSALLLVLQRARLPANGART